MLVVATFTLFATTLTPHSSDPRFSGFSLPHLAYVVCENGVKSETPLARYVTSAETRPGGLIAAVTDDEKLLVAKGRKILHKSVVPMGSEVIGWWKSWVAVRDSTDVQGYEWAPGHSEPVKHEIPGDLVSCVPTDVGRVQLEHEDFYGYYLMSSYPSGLRLKLTQGGKLVENQGDGGYHLQVVNRLNWPGNNPIGTPGSTISVRALGSRYVAIQVHTDGKLHVYIADTDHRGEDSLREAPWTVASLAPGIDASHAVAATGIQPLDLSRPISSTRLWSVDLRTLERTEIGTAPGYLAPCGVSGDRRWLISIRHEEKRGAHTLVATNLVSMKMLTFGPMMGFELARV